MYAQYGQKSGGVNGDIILLADGLYDFTAGIDIGAASATRAALSDVNDITIRSASVQNKL